MSDIRSSVERAMEIDGCLGAALVDFESGLCLGVAGNPGFDLELAAALGLHASETSPTIRARATTEHAHDEGWRRAARRAAQIVHADLVPKLVDLRPHRAQQRVDLTAEGVVRSEIERECRASNHVGLARLGAEPELCRNRLGHSYSCLDQREHSGAVQRSVPWPPRADGLAFIPSAIGTTPVAVAPAYEPRAFWPSALAVGQPISHHARP